MWQKSISTILIISLILPSLIIICGTTPVQAATKNIEPKLKSGFTTALKGLFALFIFNRLISSDDDQESTKAQTSSQSESKSSDSPADDNISTGNQPNNNQTKTTVDLANWTTMEVKELASAEKTMLNLLNQERTQRGLEPLQVDLDLVKVARAKSQDMIENDYFAHQSPTFGSPFNMLDELGINYYFAGENIAGASTVQQAHQSLMNSPGHRENILKERFTHVGIGIINGGPYGMMFTQEFIDKE
ncbi:MAG: CAP domain-containing protein [Bacillota bacterium]